MTTRRKDLGLRIKSARRAAGFKSARVFAQAIGISETSVARAEAGDKRVGTGVYLDLENALGWPQGCIDRYLESGDIGDLPTRGADAEPDLLDPQNAFEEKIVNSSLSKKEKRQMVHAYRVLDEERRTVVNPALAQFEKNRPNRRTSSHDPNTQR